MVKSKKKNLWKKKHFENATSNSNILILGEEDESSMALGLIAPQVDVSLLMPSISQSRDRIGGDFSLQDTEADATTSMYSIGD